MVAIHSLTSSKIRFVITTLIRAEPATQALSNGSPHHSLSVSKESRIDRISCTRSTRRRGIAVIADDLGFAKRKIVVAFPVKDLPQIAKAG